MMAEVLRRRFDVRRACGSRPVPSRPSSGVDEDAVDGQEWALPDLVIVDGGKGQLGRDRCPRRSWARPSSGRRPGQAVRGTLRRGHPDPILLPTKAPALYLVQRIRDEAHRFAITYHRQVRGRTALGSLFDDVPGIGPARRAALLRRFGSVRALRDASVEEIAAAPPMSEALAERVKSALAREGRLRIGHGYTRGRRMAACLLSEGRRTLHRA